MPPIQSGHRAFPALRRGSPPPFCLATDHALEEQVGRFEAADEVTVELQPDQPLDPREGRDQVEHRFWHDIELERSSGGGASEAADLGSTAWLVSHSLGMIGFVALALGLRTAAVHPPWNTSSPALRTTETLAWLAAALLVLAVVGVRLVRGLWHAGAPARSGALLVALGLATYLPQFFGTPEVRITHGLLLGAGLVLVALSPTARPTA